MKALILAAGYATRLYPLTKEYPKPLLKIGKRPIINYIIEKLQTLDDIDEVIVVTNSKFMPLFRRWLEGLDSQKPISLVDDLTKSHSDRRGAIGDMNFIISKKVLNDNLLVVGGDNLFDADLKKFLSFIKDNPHPVIGAYNIKDIRQAKKYGVIKLGKQNKLIDFQEKPQNPKSTLIAMCLYYFPKEKLGLIKKYLNTKMDKPRPFNYTNSLRRKKERGRHDATGLYIDWLRKRVPVYGFVFDGRWYDIGDHKFYREARKKFTVNSV